MTHSHGSADTTCREIFDLLSDYVDGELAPDMRSLLMNHLEECPPCVRFLRTFEKTRALCRESLMLEMPDELRTRLRAFLKDRIPRK